MQQRDPALLVQLKKKKVDLQDRQRRDFQAVLQILPYYGSTKEKKKTKVLLPRLQKNAVKLKLVNKQIKQFNNNINTTEQGNNKEEEEYIEVKDRCAIADLSTVDMKHELRMIDDDTLKAIDMNQPASHSVWVQHVELARKLEADDAKHDGACCGPLLKWPLEVSRETDISKEDTAEKAPMPDASSSSDEDSASSSGKSWNECSCFTHIDCSFPTFLTHPTTHIG